MARFRLPYTVRPLEPWIEPVTRDRGRSPFSSRWQATLDLLDDEIDKLGATSWVLQIDVHEGDIRVDGGIRARANPYSPKVRVCFESRHGPLRWACDRFDDWQANVRAIALTLEKLRAIDRYGVAGRGEQYTGWKAITAAPEPMSRQQCAELLVVWSTGNLAPDPAAVRAVLNDPHERDRAYKRAAVASHPDAGGTADTFHLVTQARAILAGDV